MLQKRIVQLGVAKQTAKGAAAATPAYVVGLTGGKVFDIEIDEQELDSTWNDRILQGHDRISSMPVVDGEIVVTPKVIGLLLLLALGQDVVTGTGPYTHTLTPTSALLYATLFPKYGAELDTVTDAKIDSLELSWDKTGALKAKVKFMGLTYTFASAWTGGTSEQLNAGVFKGPGGTFTVNGTQARVVSGNIKIENKLEAVIASYSSTPDDILEAELNITCSLTIKPDDLTLFRYAVTGSTSGTAVQTTPTYGTAVLKWVMDANDSLQFTAPRIKFLTHMPDVDPKGGAAEIVLEGQMSEPTSGAPATFVLINSVATY